MTVLEHRYVKQTRKKWVCDGCRRSFEVGTPCNVQKIVDGEFYTVRWCDTCQSIANELFTDGHEEVDHCDIREYVIDNHQRSMSVADEFYNREESQRVAV